MNKIIEQLKERVVVLWPVLLLCVAFTIASVWAHGGGHLNGEADHFLIDHNTDQRSFLSKILCPHKQDAESYMARDLAHIFEHIDARFIHFCVMNGIPHFLSITNYILIAAISIVVWWQMVKRAGISMTLATLLVELFMTAPPIFMAGVYIRAGHMLSTFLMVCLVLYLFLSSDHKRGIVFLLSLAMIWSDRQGLFAACSIGLIILLTRSPGWIMPFSAIASAVVIHTIYWLWLGPALVREYTPFADAMIPKHIFAVAGADGGVNPVMTFAKMMKNNFIGGMTIALSNLRLLLGGMSYALAVGALVFMALRFKRWWIPPMVVLLIAVMNSILMSASSVLLWPDCLPSIYYNIISTAALWLLVCFVFSSMSERKTQLFIIGCIVFANITMIPVHKASWNNGHMRGFIAGAPFMREALRQVTQAPQGTSTNKYNALESAQFASWEWIMKNPLEYQGKLTAQEFVESSQYLQFVRSEKGYPFGRGGRKQGQQP